jgi:translation initiation factor 1
MAKKITQLSDLGGFVFSTNKDFDFSVNESPQGTTLISSMRLEAHLEKKNRGGKTATVIKGFVGSDENLKQLGKMLKTRCGVGGSAKDGEIIIQGDFRNKIMEILTQEGYHVKRVGG